MGNACHGRDGKFENRKTMSHRSRTKVKNLSLLTLSHITISTPKKGLKKRLIHRPQRESTAVKAMTLI